MKKLTGLIAAAGIAFAPMSSSALEALTDNAMNDVTAQAGVSIAIDDVVLFQSVEYTKYIDEDGITETPTWLYEDSTTATDPQYETSADAAALVIGSKETLKVLNGIWTGKENAASATAGELMANGWEGTENFGATGYLNKDLNLDGVFDVFVPSELKIDIGTCTTLSRAAQTKLGIVTAAHLEDGSGNIVLVDPVEGYFIDADGDDAFDAGEAFGGTPVTIPDAYLVNGITASGAALDRADATVTGVVIGLPTLEITTTSDSYDIGVEMVSLDDQNLNSGKKFIKIEKGDSLMAILGGRLEIAPH